MDWGFGLSAMSEADSSPGRQFVVADVDGVRLCVETFGDPGHPAILLLSGMGGSMDWWDDALCERLAAGLRFVIRYDQRDTGRSSHWPAGSPGYHASDLIGDAIRVLDRVGVHEAHIVGVSMGGAIAQRLALDHPHRVASLTLIATSPAVPGGPERPALPPMSERLRAHFAGPPHDLDWGDPGAVVEHIVDTERAFAGSVPMDEPRVRAIAQRVVARSHDMAASLTNHGLIDDDEPARSRLEQVAVPTLILHGTDDPLFPLGHAEALAAEIPGADLVALPGVGHQLPPAETWDRVVPLVLAHTSGGWDEQGDRLAARALAAGDATGWFDELYQAGAAGEVAMPWSRRHPHWALATWADARRLHGAGRRAIVVGAGLGADAAYLARRGFDTLAFDVSPTAIAEARDRFADTAAEFVQADVLDPPPAWTHAFDLVVEIFTLQALPAPVRDRARAKIAQLVAPGGTLLVVASHRDDDTAAGHGPPWPLARSELDAFTNEGLRAVAVEALSDPQDPSERRWRAEFNRPGSL
ncbi:MAG TPA: alpha/beta fold hydrolase, partial [Solirubrobacteraceae bacterium]